MQPSKRLDLIPPYLFAQLERKIAEKKAAGVDVISLGIGDPDTPKCELQTRSTRYRVLFRFGVMRVNGRRVSTWLRRRNDVWLHPGLWWLQSLMAIAGIAALAVATGSNAVAWKIAVSVWASCRRSFCS